MNFGYPMASASTQALLRAALRDRAELFQIWLLEGKLAAVRQVIEKQPAALADLLPIVANPELDLNVRLGANALLEAHARTPALAALIPGLAVLTGHGDPRVRADACHLLGLTGDPAARPYLEARRDDADADVREIVAESLAELAQEE